MKGETTMRLTTLTTLLWFLSFGLALADDNPIPPVPEGGLMLMMEGACTDIETQVEGYCVMSQDRQGNIYVMFAIDGELWEIRQVVGDTYEVIWRRTPGELL